MCFRDRTESVSRRVESEIIQVEAMGNVATREGNMPLNVFNSTTVYLRNGKKKKTDEEGAGGGGKKRCHPCLNFVVCRGKSGAGGVYFDCCHHLSPAFNLPHCSS